MAPQNESSFYGSLRLGEEKEEAPRSRVTLRRVALASLVCLAVLAAAFVVSAPAAPASVGTVADVAKNIKGADNLKDCVCKAKADGGTGCMSFNELIKAGKTAWIDSGSEAYSKIKQNGDSVRLCTPAVAKCADNSGRQARIFKAGQGPMAFCRNMRGCIEARAQSKTNNVCGEQGFCVSKKGGGYACVCDKGYVMTKGASPRCVDRDELKLAKENDKTKQGWFCHKDAMTINKPGTWECKCMDGYTGDGEGGKHGRKGTGCKKIDQCAKHDCQNGSACQEKDFKIVGDIPCGPKDCKVVLSNGMLLVNAVKEKKQFDCLCNIKDASGGLTKGWKGTKCEIDIDECDSKSFSKTDKKGFITDATKGFGQNGCQMNTKCSKSQGSFMCECDGAHGWVSSTSKPVCKDAVESKARKNKAGKSCVPPGELTCVQRKDCDRTPCKNGGTCERKDRNGKPLQPGCNHDENAALAWAKARTGDKSNWDNHVDLKGYWKTPAGRVETICYTCDCSTASGGWKGGHCETDVNECTESGAVGVVGCDPNAYCVNTRGSHTCTCNRGWTGDGFHCEDANDCETNPCSHGGTCVDCGTLCFTCDCVVGWTGVTCGTDWNECLMGIHTCNNAATCVNTPGSYACKCDPGYTGNGQGGNTLLPAAKARMTPPGKADKYDDGCININDCQPNPCKNQGVCKDMEGTSGYQCTCAAGWRDENCDRNKNECNPKDPLNGYNMCSDFADCMDLDPSKDPEGRTYQCKCHYGYRDPLYQNEYGVFKPKSSLPKNRRQMGFMCTDADDCTWEASDPEVEAGARKVGPKCSAHGYCSDLGVAYSKCMCDEGWHGADCELDIDECTSDTHIHDCKEHTVCVNTPGSYECKCEHGFVPKGDLLEVKMHKKGCKDYDDCADSKCVVGVHATKCVGKGLGAGRYRCECKAGWKDFNCDHDVDECREWRPDQLPCAADAKCVNTPGSFFCRCKAGFSGNGIKKDHVLVQMKDKCVGGKPCTLHIHKSKYILGSDSQNPLVGVKGEKPIRHCATVKTKAAKEAKESTGHKCEAKPMNKEKTEFQWICCIEKGNKITGTGCTDIDDCVDAYDFYKTKKQRRNDKICDRLHGSCVDKGPNKPMCKCDKGWGGHKDKTMPNRCSVDINECNAMTATTNKERKSSGHCDVNAKCTNNEGGFTCKCSPNYYDTNAAGVDPKNKDGRPGNCQECWKKCPNAIKWRSVTIGQSVAAACTERSQMVCAEVNECKVKGGKTQNNCHLDAEVPAQCQDLDSSANCRLNPATGRWYDAVAKKHCMYRCACPSGFFGTGHGKPTAAEIASRGKATQLVETKCPINPQPRGCQRCTACLPGYIEVSPCTNKADRVCQRVLYSGKYLIESQADGNTQCFVIRPNEQFPSRVNYGNAGTKCGYQGNLSMKQIGEKYKEAVWKIEALYTNKEGERNVKKQLLPNSMAGTNLYTISHRDMVNGGGSYKCLHFGDGGKDLYPTLVPASNAQFDRNVRSNDKLCGFKGSRDPLTRTNAFVKNRLAVWKIEAVKQSEKKFILQSMSRKSYWECLAFEEQGAATNPSRYMWGNQDSQGFCGIGNWNAEGKRMALLNNKQAVFILTAFSQQENERGAKSC